MLAISDEARVKMRGLNNAALQCGSEKTRSYSVSFDLTRVAPKDSDFPER